MKITLLCAAALALLLCGCNITPPDTVEDTTTDTTTDTIQTTAAVEDSETEEEAPFVQENTHTITAEDGYTYALAQVAGFDGDDRLQLNILHTYAAGETIDFRTADPSAYAPTGKAWFLSSATTSCYVHDGTDWTLQTCTLAEGDCVYLTHSTDGSFHAVTLPDAAG